VSLRHWVIDFDETLASGVITWALDFAFPKLIEEHRLPFDDAVFHDALMQAQERAARRADPRVLLRELFTAMGWSVELETPLMQDVTTNYRPALFEDALPFLEALRERKQTAFIVSNNPQSVAAVDALGIRPFVTDVLTPKSAPDLAPKPDLSLWRLLTARHPEVTPENTAIVGDDPWSEGEFAAGCGARCWIVDRKGRFADQQDRFSVGWVGSLVELTRN
jgi:FMN phosphatase YigB (HAD superfamily)